MNKISSAESSRLTVTYRPLGDLIPDPRNARTHPKRQIDQIKASIEAFGFTNPILADPEGHIIAGHGRLQAARAMGLAELPVITLSGLSETQKRTLRIADNKIALNAGWDLEILQLELGELGSIDVDIDLTLTGFSTGEIDVILSSAADPDDEVHPTCFCNVVGGDSFNTALLGSVLRCRLKPVIDRSLPLQEIVAAFEYYESQKHFGKVCLELTAVGEAAVAIECETEMRSQRSDGRVLLRIGIGIGCGNDDDPEPAAVLATRRQHRRTQRIALPVAQREEKRHLSLYMGLEADVALDRVGPLRTPGLDCLLPVAAEIFLDCVAHQARLMRRFAFRLDAEPGLAVRRVANILHFDFACPAIPRNSRAAGLQNQYEIRSRA